MRTKFGVDIAQASAALGYMEGVYKTINTDKYVTSAVNYAYGILSDAFGIALDAAAAASDAGRLDHVYEWGTSYGDKSTIGNPTQRLWRLVSNQGGSVRNVTFVFMPSVRPVPVNPILTEQNEKNGKFVKEGIHEFTFKAAVVEYGQQVTVRPKLAKSIAFVGRNGKIMFSKDSRTFVPFKENKGAFTSFYMSWWAREADAIFESRIRPALESAVKESKFASAVRKYRRVNKNIGIVSNYGQGARSFNQAAAMAARDIGPNVGSNIARAAERRWDLYGD